MYNACPIIIIATCTHVSEEEEEEGEGEGEKLMGVDYVRFFDIH
jgi:hypothetical protein